MTFTWCCFRFNVVCVCFNEAGVSEAWTSRSCKCDCEGGEAPTEFSTIGTGSMVRGVDCMPGTLTTIKYSFLSFLKICDSALEFQTDFFVTLFAWISDFISNEVTLWPTYVFVDEMMKWIHQTSNSIFKVTYILKAVKNDEPRRVIVRS